MNQFVFWLSSISLAVLCSPLSVMGLELRGDFVQGGVLIGSVVPGTRVVCSGKQIRVSKKGHFVVGFDRDSKLKILLQIRTIEGHIEEHPILIKKREYNIQNINGLPKKKVTPDTSNLKQIREETAMVKQARERNEYHTDFTDTFVWPLKGRITGVYGSQRVLNGNPRAPHYGIDIAAPVGTPVKAPAGGIVTFTHPNMFFSGGTMIVDHGHGLSSSFLHLHKILVATGKRVKKGDVIAEVGATGRVTGAHLDWRMNWFKNRVDPALLVPPMGMKVMPSE